MSSKTRKPKPAEAEEFEEEPTVEAAAPAKVKGRCEVCGDQSAPNSTEGLCWVCRRLKISAWRDGDPQIVQE